MESLGKDCCGQEIIPIEGESLCVHTNRHTTTGGSLWGWITGTDCNTVWSNERTFNKQQADELVRKYNAKQKRRGGDGMGMHDDTELCLMTKATMQAALDFLRDLASEWEWKRNSIPKNDREMADLDLLIGKLEQRLYNTDESVEVNG